MRMPRVLVAILPGFLLRYAQSLRFPQLFLLAAVLLCVDFFIPDPVPFLDEIMLTVVTLIFSRLKAPKNNLKEIERE